MTIVTPECMNTKMYTSDFMYAISRNGKNWTRIGSVWLLYKAMLVFKRQ